jgi:hypothetical protein
MYYSEGSWKSILKHRLAWFELLLITVITIACAACQLDMEYAKGACAWHAPFAYDKKSPVLQEGEIGEPGKCERLPLKAAALPILFRV